MNGLSGYTYPVGTGVYRRPRAETAPETPTYAANPLAQGPTGRPGGTSPYQYAYGADPVLMAQRNSMMQDYGARMRAAHLAGTLAGGNDASLGAFGGLSGMLHGQGDMARELGRSVYQRESDLDSRKWQEYLLRLQMQLQEQMQRDANKGAMWGSLGQLGGAAIGALL